MGPLHKSREPMSGCVLYIYLIFIIIIYGCINLTKRKKKKLFFCHASARVESSTPKCALRTVPEVTNKQEDKKNNDKQTTCRKKKQNGVQEFCVTTIKMS